MNVIHSETCAVRLSQGRRACDCWAPRRRVLAEVLDERARQDARFGVQDHEPAVYLSLLVEEVGEAAKEINDSRFFVADGRTNAVREALHRARVELVQVAAVAVAMVEALDRRLA